MLNCDYFSSRAVNSLVDCTETPTSELLQHRVLIRHGTVRRHIADFAKQERWVLGMRRASLTRTSSESEKGWSGKSLLLYWQLFAVFCLLYCIASLRALALANQQAISTNGAGAAPWFHVRLNGFSICIATIDKGA